MDYFYIHPFKPQYFFPKGFKEHTVFTGFFRPFSFLGSVSWWLFKNNAAYRQLFRKKNIGNFIPEENIRNICGKKALMAFNMGTLGPERKITALGFDQGNYFFIKYAQTPLAIANVKNEYAVLSAMKTQDFVPSVEDFREEQHSVLLKTNVLQGNRLGALKANNEILQCLIQISMVKINFNYYDRNDLKSVFAHGDFCPWNLMLSNGKILVFDWEMGGNYPLGYDLFTYIFMTGFLLFPKVATAEILSKNQPIIEAYFKHFKISDWHPYLLAFAEIKIHLDQRNGKTGLLERLNELLLLYGQDI
jgi:hypothetical protein